MPREGARLAMAKKKKTTKKTTTTGKKKTTTRKASTRGRKTTSKAGSSSRRTAAGGVTKDHDVATVGKITDLSRRVESLALGGDDPFVDIPTRSLSNTRWDDDRRILAMGESRQRRNLFNLGQARKFMQTMLMASACKDLVEVGKTLSLRGMYYRTLHTIAGTKEKTFADQSESDPILEDLEVSLGALREELHVFAKKRGTMVGNITIVDSGDVIDCRRMGSGGYSIPSIVERGTVRIQIPPVVNPIAMSRPSPISMESRTMRSRFNLLAWLIAWVMSGLTAVVAFIS